MKKNYLFLITALFILVSSSLFAQESEKEEKKSSFKFGVDYINSNVFMGRTDTIAAPIISPSATYTFAFGLFITAAADYIPNRTKNRLDDGNIGIGYNYEITDNWAGSISLTKMFYASTSTQIASSVSSELNGNIQFTNDYLTPGIALDFAKGKTGKKNDFFINPSLSHDFIIAGLLGETDYLSISPMVSLNAGTQNFYDSYFGKVNKLKHPKNSTELAAFRKGLTKFRLLDYELSAPVEYSLKPFLISFNPTLAIPENKLPYTITKSQANKSSLFYFDLGLSLKF